MPPKATAKRRADSLRTTSKSAYKTVKSSNPPTSNPPASSAGQLTKEPRKSRVTDLSPPLRRSTRIPEEKKVTSYAPGNHYRKPKLDTVKPPSQSEIPQNTTLPFELCSARPGPTAASQRGQSQFHPDKHPASHEPQAPNKQSQPSEQPLASKVNPWLDSLRPEEPPEVQPLIDRIYEMSYSLALADSTPPTNMTDATTNARQRAVIAKTVNQRTKQLKDHSIRIQPEPLADTGSAASVTKMLQSAMQQDQSLSKEDYNKLLGIVTDFAERGCNVIHAADRYREFQAFRQTLNNALPACGLFTMTAEDFETDIARARICQEAMLQRTVLLSIIDRSRLDSMFLYDCEAVWQVAPEHIMPYIRSDAQEEVFKSSKPDLAIYFDIQNICPRRSAEEEVFSFIDPGHATCIHPDGKAFRCFPFLFLEAKKQDETLSIASLDCLQAASQALQNIFACMKKAETTSKLEEVLTFSIALNTVKFEVRVHYATKTIRSDGVLVFRHHVIGETGMYNRDSVCRVVQKILQNYASPTLLPILRDTFSKLMQVVSTEEWNADRTREIFNLKTQNQTSQTTEESRAPNGVAESTARGMVPVSQDYGGQGSRRSRTPESALQREAGQGKRLKRNDKLDTRATAVRQTDSFGASTLSMEDK